MGDSVALASLASDTTDRLLPALTAPSDIDTQSSQSNCCVGPTAGFSSNRPGELDPLLELLDTHLCDLPPFLQGRAPDSGETKS
jgi:hypothetical protein